MLPVQESRHYTPKMLRGVNVEQRTVDIIASNYDLDSHGTRMDPDGWDLERFKKNPVICLQHDSYGATEACGLPIAKALPETIRVENGQLKMRVLFPPEGMDPLADRVFNLIAGGFLNAVSVGFNPDMEAFEQVTEEDDEGNSRLVGISRKHELLEVSFVTIPSNGGTLVQRAIQVGRQDELEKILQMTRQVEELAEQELGPPEPLRWNRSLSTRFDVADEKIEPAALEFDWVAKHIGCEVKEVFQNSFKIPSFRIGGVLSGLKNALLGSTLVEVRNLTWSGTELPPEYNVIQLNSRQSEDFLIDGLAFYEGGEGNFAYRIYPVWGGLRVDFYSHRDAKDFNRRAVDEAWRFAKENNPLKGEAFALSGEFIRKTDESWDDCFLEEKNSKALTRIVERMNEKGKATPNRGVIMMGPPGTGKTLSGRIIRNTLKDCSFIWVSTRDFHYGGGFTQAFELAREIAPSVLFFEDIDNWVGGNIDLLKTEMDGISRSSGVVTVMTTNFPETLPEALIDRPGRFHDVLNFNLPTPEKRSAMLKKWVEGLSDADVEDAVAKTKGYSGAHMYELASFARNLMEADELTVSDALREAIKKVEEQRDLITKVQLQGSNYRPRRSRGVRQGEKAATLVPDMPSKSSTVEVRVADLPQLQTELAGLHERVKDMEQDFDKYKSYFERKQPANRAATKVLSRFFKARGLEAPSDEAEAWEKMGELMTQETEVPVTPGEETVTETTVTEVPAEEVKPEEKAPESTPAEEPKPEEKAPEQKVEEVVTATAETIVEEKAEEPTPSPNPTAPVEAAPQPERKLTPAAPAKRTVTITLSALKALPEMLGQKLSDEAAAALRGGMSPKDLGGFLDKKGKELFESLIHS